MAIVARLVLTAFSGAFTYLTRKKTWLAAAGAVSTIGSAFLVVVQIIKELKALGWIS